MKIRIRQLLIQIFFLINLILFSNFTAIKNDSALEKRSHVIDNTNFNSNPDYTKKYKKIEFYIPDENTPVKHIRIAINIFTGPATIQNTSESVKAIVQMINWLNGFYTNVDSATYPIDGVQRLTDTKIRFDLDDRIFFYEGTKLYNSTAIQVMEKYIAGVDSSRLNNLNVYMTAGGPASPYSIAPYPGFIKEGGGPTAGSLDANQGIYISTTNPCYVNSQTLAHEFGHALDLFHTYKPSCCHETCDASDPEYLYDLFGPAPSVDCWEKGHFGCKITPGENTCTNNAMGGNNMLYYYFSPMQIGKMHRALSIKTVRKYVKEDAFCPAANEISKNEKWNFDFRSYGDIVIKAGATLTITGRVLMPEQARIVIKRGAFLIVDAGVITSVGQSWLGIKTEGKRNKLKRLLGAKGEVVLKNGALIINTLK